MPYEREISNKRIKSTNPIAVGDVVDELEESSDTVTGTIHIFTRERIISFGNQ
jgi:hypothetical protein